MTVTDRFGTDLTPVETETGERLRQAALRILTARHEWLSERSTRYDFSPIEGQQLAALRCELDRLAAMAPSGPLRPPRLGGFTFPQ